MPAQLDVVIPAHPKDVDTLDVAVGCILRNLPETRTIHVVSGFDWNHESDKVRRVPEPGEDILPGVETIRRRWESAHPPLAGRAGWLYQQLLGLGAGGYIDGLLPSYLCIDADTFFLRPVRFLFEGIRFVYCDSPQLARPEYAAAHRRFTGEDQLPRSFTAHHMLFDRDLLAELFEQVERLHGKPWHEAILDSADFRVGSCFNDWDTYASWVLTHHPEASMNRPLEWADVRYIPHRLARRRLSRKLDFVSAHAYMRQPLPGRVRHRVEMGTGRILRRTPGIGGVIRTWRGEPSRPQAL
jgi:hypothetical protein